MGCEAAREFRANFDDFDESVAFAGPDGGRVIVEPVEFIQKHHDRITNLHIKDRKRNDGPNVPFGQGDTPITAVLQLLKREHYPIPAFIEYEYQGTGTVTEEVGKCLAYARDALATTR